MNPKKTRMNIYSVNTVETSKTAKTKVNGVGEYYEGPGDSEF